MVKTASDLGGSTFEGDGFRETKGFSSAGTPIYLGLKQELFLYENNEFDLGVIDYLMKKGVALEEPHSQEKKAILSLTPKERIRLDEILDTPFTHPSSQNIYGEDGFLAHGNQCVGAIPITRGIYGIPRREDFIKDFIKTAETFKANIELTEEEKKIGIKDKTRMDEIRAFGETLYKNGFYKKENGKITMLRNLSEVYDNPRTAGLIVTNHTNSFLEKWVPSKHFAGRKELNLQQFNDRAITALEFDKEKNRWKSHGWFYVLDVPNDGKYLYFRDNSSNGSWVIKDGNAKSEIQSLEHLAELDKADDTLKVNGKGNIDLVKNFVSEKDGKVTVQMTRTPKRGVSQIYNTLLGKMGEKWKAEIRMGTYSPGAHLPQNILEISTY